MEYGDEECIVCYAIEGQHNSCLEIYDDDFNYIGKRDKNVICLDCTRILFESDKRLTLEVHEELSTTLIIHVSYVCFLCRTENTIGFKLACCEEHKHMNGEDWSDSSECDEM